MTSSVLRYSRTNSHQNWRNGGTHKGTDHNKSWLQPLKWCHGSFQLSMEWELKVCEERLVRELLLHKPKLPRVSQPASRFTRPKGLCSLSHRFGGRPMGHFTDLYLNGVGASVCVRREREEKERREREEKERREREEKERREREEKERREREEKERREREEKERREREEKERREREEKERREREEKERREREEKERREREEKERREREEKERREREEKERREREEKERREREEKERREREEKERREREEKERREREEKERREREEKERREREEKERREREEKERREREEKERREREEKERREREEKERREREEKERREREEKERREREEKERREREEKERREREEKERREREEKERREREEKERREREEKERREREEKERREREEKERREREEKERREREEKERREREEKERREREEKERREREEKERREREEKERREREEKERREREEKERREREEKERREREEKERREREEKERREREEKERREREEKERREREEKERREREEKERREREEKERREREEKERREREEKERREREEKARKERLMEEERRCVEMERREREVKERREREAKERREREAKERREREEKEIEEREEKEIEEREEKEIEEREEKEIEEREEKERHRHAVITCQFCFASVQRSVFVAHFHQQHLTTRYSATQTVCPLCDAALSKRDFASHLRSDHSTALLSIAAACPICNNDCDLSQMVSHMCRCFHRPESRLPSPSALVKCPFCHKEMTFIELLDHIENEEAVLHHFEDDHHPNLRRDWSEMRQRTNDHGGTEATRRAEHQLSETPNGQNLARLVDFSDLSSYPLRSSSPCPFCVRTIRPDTFISHLVNECRPRTKYGSLYRCPLCSVSTLDEQQIRAFTSPNLLLDHLKLIHAAELTRTPRHTDFDTRYPFHLRSHLEYSYQDFFCSHCFVLLRTSDEVVHHVIEHHRQSYLEMTVDCPFCHFSYRLKNMMEHNIRLSLTCPFCFQRVQANLILDHMRYDHYPIHLMEDQDGNSLHSRCDNLQRNSLISAPFEDNVDQTTTLFTRQMFLLLTVWDIVWASQTSLPIPISLHLHSSVFLSSKHDTNSILIQAGTFSANANILCQTIHLQGKRETYLVSLPTANAVMFDLRNTTFSLFSTQLHPSQLAFHLEESTISLHRTSIVLSSASSPIVSKNSQTVLNSVSILTNHPALPLPTLVTSDATNNHATMTGTTICNFVVCPNSPILATVETPQTISSCVLANLTQPSMSADDQISSKPCEVVMAGSSVVSVESPLYGCVVPNINTAGSFFFLNSSFTRASASYQDQHFTNTNPVPSVTEEMTLTFDTCTFTGCTSEQAGGSFHYMRVNGELTVKHCSFLDCLAGQGGGGFRTQNVSKAVVNNSSFTNCRAAHSGGGVVLNNADVNCQATHNNFTGCSGDSGSALHRNGVSQSETTTITENRFVGCISKTGSDLSETQTAGVVVIACTKSTVVSSNIATDNQIGTGKYVYWIRPYDFTSLKIENNVFSGNTVLDQSEPDNRLVIQSYLSLDASIPVSSPWTFTHSCAYSSAPPASESKDGDSLDMTLVHSGTGSLVVPTDFVGTHVLQLDESAALTATISLDLSACNTAGIAQLETGSKLTVQFSSLSLSSSPITRDLFVVDSSSLILKSSTFPAMEFESTSILCVRGDSTVQVNGITTTTISQSGESAVGGCFLRVEDSSPATITVTGSTFGGCSTTGSGGWGSCAFGEGGRLEVSGTTFTTCTAAGKGSLLFVSHPSLSTCLSATTLSCLGIGSLPATKSETDPFVPLVYATSVDGWNGSILLHLFPHTTEDGPVHLHSQGFSGSDCGKLQLPCLSLVDSLASLKEDRTIFFDTPFDLKFGSSRVITQDLSLTSGSPIKALSLFSSDPIHLQNGRLSFSSITLQLPSIVSSSIFVVDGGTLEILSTVTLVNPATASLHVAPLIDISNGQLVVDSSVFDFSTKLTMSGASMISQTGGNVNWKRVALSNVECSADADSNSDSPITSSLSDGCSLSIGDEEKETSFTNCGSKGDGGVLNVKIVSTGSLSITNAVFKKCCSSKNGGVLFLDLTDTTSSSAYSFSQLTFGATGSSDACTAAEKGEHMFFAIAEGQAEALLTPLQTQSLVPSRPADSATFSAAELSLLEFEEGGIDVGSVLFVVFKEISNVVVDGTENVGFAHPLCGHAYLPCGSVIGGYHSAASNEANEGSVLMKTDISLLGKLTTTDKDVKMKGVEGKKLTITAEGQFEVSAGSLTFSSITLQLTLPLTSTPFVVTGGQLTMTTTSSLTHTGTPTSPIVLAESLFHVTSGSLSITGSETTPQRFSSFSAQSLDSCLIRVDTNSHSISEPSLELLHCEFTNNVGSSAGVISLSGAAGGSLKMEHCFFTANSGSTSKDVLIIGGWASSVSSTSIVACFSESDLNHLVVEGTLMNTLIPFSVLFVHPTLSDDSSCNQPTVSCSTILKSLTHCTQTEPDSGIYIPRTIEMEANQEESATLVIDTKRVVIQASSTDVVLTWAPLTPSSLLTISTGSASLVGFVLSLPSDQSISVLVLSGAGELKLTNFKLNGANPARNGDPFLLTSSFIKTQNETGSLSLVSVNVSNVDLANHPLISTVGKVEMESCLFENIVRSDDDGKAKASVLQSTLSSSTGILVKDTEFTSCVGNNEERWIELCPTTTMTFSASLFEGSFSASSPLLAFSVNNPLKVSDAQFNPYSLLYEFHPANPTQIVVWSEKSVEDHPLCGNVSMPCLTVNDGIALTKVWSVEVSNTGMLNNSIDVTSTPLTLTGQTTHSTLVFVGQSQIVNRALSFERKTKLADLKLDVSQSTLTDDSLFVMEAGSLKITNCSLVSTNNISFMIINSKTTVQIDELTLTNLNFSATPFIFSSSNLVTLNKVKMNYSLVSTLISCSAVASLEIESCHFTGITQPLTRNEEGLCGWSTGLISLSDTNCTLRSSSFVDLDDGGLIVSDSELHIESSTFHDNTPNDAVFVSARKNIACVGESVVVVGSLSGGDGVESSSLWISTNESCLVMKEGKEHLSPLFIPTFDSNNSKVTTKKDTFTLSLSGSLLIPCGLYLVVYEVGVGGEGVRGKTIHVPLTNATDWTEQSLQVNLTQNEIDLNTKFEWRLTLGYGNECETSESILMKLSLAAERKALTTRMMKWLIPVIVAVVALLVLILFVVICYHRKRKNKSKQPNQQQLQEIEDLPEEKIEEAEFILNQHTTTHVDAGAEVTNCVVKTNATGFTQKLSMEENREKEGFVEMVKVVKCEDPVEVVMVNKKNTLFNILHKDRTQLPISKVELQKKIVKGLAYLGTIEPTAPILKKLSTHWILIDASGNPAFLRQDDSTQNAPASNNPKRPQLDPPDVHEDGLNPQKDTTGWENAIQAEPHNPLTQNRSMDTLQSQTSSFFGLGPASVRNAGMSEAIRWQAPEQENGREGYDACKAAVFRLGLVLWEIETGKVPFGEQDAVNASRQLCTGTQPAMEGVGEDLEELIKHCLVLDPKARLSLLEVAEFFFNKNELTFGQSKANQPPLKQQPVISL
ncbi:putative Titin like protein [Blattamonas nauphoetae]|uniref:Titin like protein n=1 Tax=Blattamonas nauphoetae TaxID=2049346 RepID=A0ABQ9WU99_9EUKA|nr:putative Titin like protein [Blattamonas nauphoetae]